MYCPGMTHGMADGDGRISQDVTGPTVMSSVWLSTYSDTTGRYSKYIVISGLCDSPKRFVAEGGRADEQWSLRESSTGMRSMRLKLAAPNHRRPPIIFSGKLDRVSFNRQHGSDHAVLVRAEAVGIATIVRVPRGSVRSVPTGFDRMCRQHLPQPHRRNPVSSSFAEPQRSFGRHRRACRSPHGRHGAGGA